MNENERKTGYVTIPHSFADKIWTAFKEVKSLDGRALHHKLSAHDIKRFTDYLFYLLEEAE